jgi:hypothetical protein
MGVLGRKVFYSVVNGKIVFNDMAIVITQMGDMVEPVNMATYDTQGLGMDMVDEISMITELVQVDAGQYPAMPPFTNEGMQLHAVNTPKGW